MNQDKEIPIKKKVSEKEFKAFCSLLSDESERTFSLLAKDFKSIILQEPKWKEWVCAQKELYATPRVKELLCELRRDEIESEFKELVRKEKDQPDLEEGLFLLSSFADIELKKDEVSDTLDKMGKVLNPVLQDAETPEHVIRIFRHYCFEMEGFRGNQSNFYDPDNCYIHKVLTRKLGIPISLSSVCLLLAKRLHWHGKLLPLVGVGLPMHFIIQFRFPQKSVFLDPFNRGKILSRKDCIELLHNHDIAFNESYLHPVNSQIILSRTITNLIHIYSNLGDDRKRDQLLKYLQIISGSGESRDST